MAGAFIVYCIELTKKDRDKADTIMHKYYVDGDIDIKHLEYSRRGQTTTVQYWLTGVHESIVGVMIDELKENGIELF